MPLKKILQGIVVLIATLFFLAIGVVKMVNFSYHWVKEENHWLISPASTLSKNSFGTTAQEILQRYFANLRELSPRNEGIINSPIDFPGNDAITLANIHGTAPKTSIKNKGGVFIGTGPGLALEFVFHSDVESVYLLNNNLFETEVIWPILFVLYGENEDRLDFFAELFSVEFSPHKRKFFEGKGASEVIMNAEGNRELSDEKFRKNVQRFVSLLKPYVSPAVDNELSAMVSGFFWNLCSFYRFGSELPDGYFPIELFDEAISDIDALNGTLSSQAAYKKTRDIILSGKLKVVTGDFAGEGLGKISKEISLQGKKVSLLYLSNIGRWLIDDSWESYFKMLENLKTLPVTETALVLRSIYEAPPMLPNQFFSEFLEMATSSLSLPSKHSIQYKIMANGLFLEKFYSEFIKPEGLITHKVSLIRELYRNLSGSTSLSEQREDLSQGVENFFNFFVSKDISEYHLDQFRNREEFRLHLEGRGFKELDPFDFDLVYRIFKVIGIIQEPTQSTHLLLEASL